VTSGHHSGTATAGDPVEVHSHAGGSHDARSEVQAQQGVNWHREVPHPTAPAVDANGRLPLTELTFDKAAAPSPFGDDVRFPLPPQHLNFAHPQQDEPKH
jgi:succinate dehydrogenase / fumarate reductase iron-sulfur subunit